MKALLFRASQLASQPASQPSRPEEASEARAGSAERGGPQAFAGKPDVAPSDYRGGWGACRSFVRLLLPPWVRDVREGPPRHPDADRLPGAPQARGSPGRAPGGVVSDACKRLADLTEPH